GRPCAWSSVVVVHTPRRHRPQRTAFPTARAAVLSPRRPVRLLFNDAASAKAGRLVQRNPCGVRFLGRALAWGVAGFYGRVGSRAVSTMGGRSLLASFL